MGHSLTRLIILLINISALTYHVNKDGMLGPAHGHMAQAHGPIPSRMCLIIKLFRLRSPFIFDKIEEINYMIFIYYQIAFYSYFRT